MGKLGNCWKTESSTSDGSLGDGSRADVMMGTVPIETWLLVIFSSVMLRTVPGGSKGPSHAGLETTVEKVLGNENEEASPAI